MKIISLVAAFAFFVYGCLPSYAAAPFAPENTSYAELGQTAGFLAGQHAGLEKIKTEFPELAPSAQIAEAGFEVSFGKAEKSVTNEIKNLMKDKYAEYEQNLKSQIRDNQNKQILSQDTAANFISEVSARAKGDIPSPILETLLTYQYKDNPSEEFSRKYIHTFSTKNHAKAKGTNLTFSYPASWKAAEGNRPNIIQKFVSENGHGLEMFLVMVKDMPLPQGHIMTPQELDEFFIEKELKEMLPENSDFISAKPIILDNFKAGVLLFDQTVQRLDIKKKFRTQMYITIVKDKMIFLQFMVTDKEDGSLQSRFDMFEPLFKKVANSLIVQSQYE